MPIHFASNTYRAREKQRAVNKIEEYKSFNQTKVDKKVNGPGIVQQNKFIPMEKIK